MDQIGIKSGPNWSQKLNKKAPKVDQKWTKSGPKVDQKVDEKWIK